MIIRSEYTRIKLFTKRNANNILKMGRKVGDCADHIDVYCNNLPRLQC